MEQLSITLQHKDLTVQEAVSASKLAVLYLERQRTEQAFERFYSRAVQDSRDLTAEPTLPRYRKRPRRIEDGESNHRFDTTEAYFRQQYYEALDLLKNELINRFQQPRGLPVAASIQKVLLDATHGVVSDELPDESTSVCQ